MNITATREAIASALDREEWQVSPFVLAQPSPPGIQVLPPAVVYDFATGFDEWTFTVQAFVALTTDVGAQMDLDELCDTAGEDSVKARLEADLTLGGLVDNLVVREQTPGRQVEQPPGNPMLLVEWRLTIYADGGGG